MKSFINIFFLKFGSPFDFIFSILIIPCAYVLLLFRLAGAKRLPLTSLRLKNIGVFPIKKHYYEPLFDHRLLKNDLSTDRYLPGINLNINSQIDFLSHLRFCEELKILDLKNQSSSVSAFQIDNGSFTSGDAEFLYQFIRYMKPSKIIEIGSGNSTKIARIAINKNNFEDSKFCEHICIEPFEMPWLEELSDITLLRKPIEDCDINWSDILKSGDLLFIDSSHIIRPQGDVLKEYLEILPQLKKGVFIHIHDIFTPKDYPATWIEGDVKFWNEQYLLEALLTNSSRYEVIAALNYLKNNHFDSLSQVCPYLTLDHEPGSFYLRTN